MDWFAIFVVALFVSAPPGKCSCDTGVLRSYGLGPGDVDLGEMDLFESSPGRLLLLKRASGTDSVQVYETSDSAMWRRMQHQDEVAVSHLVASSGAAQGRVLYRLSNDDSVLERSVDGGQSWITAQLRFQSGDSAQELDRKRLKIAIVGTNGLTLYGRVYRRAGQKDLSDAHVASWPGVYVSRDGGDDWQPFARDLVVGTAVADRGDAVFAVSASGLVQSKDNGRNWSAALMGYHLPKSFSITGAEKAPPDRREKSLAVYQMEFPADNPDSVFLVTNGGLFITHNAGENWCLTTFGSDMFNMVSSVALANPSGSHVFATTVDRSGPALWESRDAGLSFRRISVGTARQE
jgi:hypothetical protein